MFTAKRVYLRPTYFFLLVACIVTPNLARAAGEYVGCFQPDSIVSEKTPEPTVENMQPPGLQATRRPYLRNHSAECVLVSDVNLKMSAGLTFRRSGDPIYVMFDLMDCMHRSGCYLPGRGVLDSPDCFTQLCRCNKQMVRESITCEGSDGFDCSKMRKSLANGGGGELWVVKNGMGHAVQITYLDCANNVGKFRDPNDPSKEDVFRLDSDGRLHTDTNPMMNDSWVYGSYSVSR